MHAVPVEADVLLTPSPLSTVANNDVNAAATQKPHLRLPRAPLSTTASKASVPSSEGQSKQDCWSQVSEGEIAPPPPVLAHPKCGLCKGEELIKRKLFHEMELVWGCPPLWFSHHLFVTGPGVSDREIMRKEQRVFGPNLSAPLGLLETQTR